MFYDAGSFESLRTLSINAILVVALLTAPSLGEEPAAEPPPGDFGDSLPVLDEKDDGFRGDIQDRPGGKVRHLSAENICLPAVTLDTVNLEACASCKDRCGEVANVSP